jgi:hypothetical protein
MKIFQWSQPLIVVLTVFLIQCVQKPLLKGHYQGVFTIKENGSLKSGPASIHLEDSIYQSLGQPDRIPAGGFGSLIIRDTVMEFRDKNIWTADFDWHLILDGKYRYNYTGDSLILRAVRPNGNSYVYRLKRVDP